MDDETLIDVSRIVSSIVLCIPLFIFAVRLFFRKALVVSGPKTAVAISLTCFGAVLIMLLIQDLRFETSYAPLIPVVIVFFILIPLRRMIPVFNVEESTLYDSIRNILQRLDINFSESSNRFWLVKTATWLECTTADYFDFGLIRYDGTLPANFVSELRNAVVKIRPTKISRFGLLVFMIGLFYLSMSLSDFLPNNGMGLSRIPYGRPLTSGEELLARTLTLIPISFMLWAVAGVILGLRLLYRRPFLLEPWWFAVPLSLPSLMIALRAVGSQFMYGFDFADSVLTLYNIFIIFLVFEFGWVYYIFNIAEDDLLESLKAVLSKRDLALTRSRGRIPIGSGNNYVVLGHTRSFAATIRLNSKSFPHWKEFLSELRVTLSKKHLAEFPKFGLTIMLISIAFLGFWFAPYVLYRILP